METIPFIYYITYVLVKEIYIQRYLLRLSRSMIMVDRVHKR